MTRAEADNFEIGRDQIRADLPQGWIVASWRIER